MKAIQYTIRGIPPEVDRALRKKARDQKVSLNQILVDELKQATGPHEPRKKRDLSDLAGSWEPDPKFDKFVEEMRTIDWEKWK